MSELVFIYWFIIIWGVLMAIEMLLIPFKMNRALERAFSHPNFVSIDDSDRMLELIEWEYIKF